MALAEVIREAKTEQELYSLLNAYEEDVGCDGKPGYLFDRAPMLLSRSDDVIKRCLGLMGELDRASKRLDDYACAALKEALHIFSIALDRLKLLESEQQQSISGYRALYIVKNNAAPGLSDSGMDARQSM
jgi:hypothetical protein